MESVFAAWRQPRLGLTLLWALAVGSLAAGWIWAEEAFVATAARQTALLMPDEPMDDAQRRQVAERLAQEPGVGSAQWLGPQDLARRFGQAFPDDRWRALLPTDDPEWMPWLLEATPDDPLEGLDRVESFVARRRQEGGWTVLWDAEPTRRLLQERLELRWTLESALALALILGVAALAATPWPRPGGTGLWLWSIALGGLAPLAPVVLARMAGAPTATRAPVAAIVVGLILAGGLAPLIRKREPSRLALTVSEDSDERA
jgi:cell division protein FtsX